MGMFAVIPLFFLFFTPLQWIPLEIPEKPTTKDADGALFFLLIPFAIGFYVFKWLQSWEFFRREFMKRERILLIIGRCGMIIGLVMQQYGSAMVHYGDRETGLIFAWSSELFLILFASTFLFSCEPQRRNPISDVNNAIGFILFVYLSAFATTFCVAPFSVDGVIVGTRIFVWLCCIPIWRISPILPVVIICADLFLFTFIISLTATWELRMWFLHLSYNVFTGMYVIDIYYLFLPTPSLLDQHSEEEGKDLFYLLLRYLQNQSNSDITQKSHKKRGPVDGNPENQN